MKTSPSRQYALVAFVFLLMLIPAIYYTASSFSQSGARSVPPSLQKSPFAATPTRPVNCAPLPYPANSKFPRTPTPDLASGTIPPAALGPTVTPIPFSNIYDLDPSIRQEDKGSVIVFRCDGSWDFYWLDPDMDISQSVPLAEGDCVWMVNPPASIVGKKPPEITATSMPETTTLTISSNYQALSQSLSLEGTEHTE